MNKGTKLEGTIEFGKSLLILLLACSALWMLGSGSLGQRIELPGGGSDRVTGTQNSAAGQDEAVRPLSITATLESGEEPVRYSARYDETAVDALFRQSAGLLMEALSSVEQPMPIDRQEWERALRRAPGLCFDFQGEIPLSVLTGWLNVEMNMSDAMVRRILLTGWQDTAALYYQDLGTEEWYRCVTQVVSTAQLEDVLSDLNGNGAYYAFESEQTAEMERDTLLLPDAGELIVYSAANPMAAGRSSLEALMGDLGFNLSGCVFYSGAGEEVGRSGPDTLRMSKDGVVEYHTNERVSHQFPVAAVSGRSQLFAAAEACRQLLRQATHERCGQVRTYLSRIDQTADGWHLEFEYSLNGVALNMDEGPAASFEVKADSITEFTLRLRSYTPGEEYQILLPPAQAAAAMSALSLDGRELQVTYEDRGEEWIRPNWTAVSEETR